MKLGIVGLPNVGKSTLFNALTNAGAESANYPFCTIEPNVGVVTVPDARLDYLAEMYQPKKYTPATIEFVDIAGLVKGASQGEGLGNKFLGDIRNTDAIVHVVRCFDNADIIRHECSHDPVSDIETVDLELILADIEMLRRRQDKAEKNAKSGDKKFKKEAEVLGRLIEWMDGGRSARSFEADEEEREIIAASDLLTNKPIIYAANLDEDGFSAGAENNAYYRQVKALEAQNKIDHTPKAIKERTITEKPKPNRSAQQARRQLTICEKEISAQETAIAEIEQRLEEVGSDYERYSEIYKEKEAAEETLGALMEKWESLAEQAGE